MKISPISVLNKNYQPKFKGQKFYFTSDMYNACWSLTQDTTYAKNGGTAKIAALGHPNPNVTVVKVENHNLGLDSVYWADPLETLSEERMKEFSFVVFENEPEYPALEKFSEAYFGGYLASENIKETSKFANVRDYFYRLEMADQKELKRLYKNEHKEYNFHQLKEKIDFYQNRINFAKFKQWEAAECLNITSDAYKLWEQKYELAKSVEFITSDLQNFDKRISKYESYIEMVREKLEPTKEKIFLFREKLSKYRTLEKLSDSLPETEDSKEEKDFIKAQIQNCKTSIQMYLRKAAEYQKEIKSFKDAIASCQEEKITYPALLQEYTANLEKVKSELLPHFEKLKNFYIKQGLKLK